MPEKSQGMQDAAEQVRKIESNIKSAPEDWSKKRETTELLRELKSTVEQQSR
ncbi:hypothetical protein [Streptomyces sp. NBC_01264]|uniref:hypothetical protein n=1 Tax=Streptomyces sp. NBC_01264 TaxID=2903804 RepID=UPI0022505D05|nr:hypothetical protein [Streptomyces sp. NBC_01264]MCX4775352.1 hypothetical protein [Streptomyces sp. NBC_01264]MCX4775413.1 hypothetical protein [Streptomyces sp. NBC_01264]